MQNRTMQDSREQKRAEQESILSGFVKRFVYSEMQPTTPTDIEAANIVIREMEKRFMQVFKHD